MERIESPECPRCGRRMVLRRPKPGQSWAPFWGCSGFRQGCRGTRPNSTSLDVGLEKFQDYRWSRYQLSIFGEVEKGKDNLTVWACPGSGKTTLLQFIAVLMTKWRPKAKVAYLVFGKRDQLHAVTKFPRSTAVKTTHSFGFAGIRKLAGSKKVRLKPDKVRSIVKAQIDWGVDGPLVTVVTNIVGKIKNTLLEPTIPNIEYVIDHWGIEVNGKFERVVQLVQETIKRNNQDQLNIDYNDMLYLAVILNAPIEQFDVLLTDEIQDFNAAQLELLKRALKPGGVFIGVGDSNQSMYGFRAAELDAMEQIGEAFKAKEMPLSITYRVPKSGVRLVNAMFPDIQFEAAPDAPEGSVEFTGSYQLAAEVADGDMVLCRTNAPLVTPCLNLIRQGIKAVILGRDIGKGLVTFMAKFPVTLVTDLIAGMYDYLDVELPNLRAAEKNTTAQILEDKVETIVALSEGCRTVRDVERKIESIFSDDAEGVVFSTVHKAKGAEAENVFILEPQLLPHPMATKDWEVRQERNICLVAVTRHKNRLVFLDRSPGYYLGEFGWPLVDEELEEVTVADETWAELTEEVSDPDLGIVPRIPDCPF